MAVCDIDILGVKSLILYENEGVIITRPDIDIENEVSISTAGATISVPNTAKPKWSQEISTSGNYQQFFNDEFTFNLRGLDDATLAELAQLISKRVGFLVQLTTNNNEIFLFQSPSFVDTGFNKKENANVWEVLLKYRVPTLLEYLDVVIVKYYYTTYDGINEYTNIAGKSNFSYIQNVGVFGVSVWFKLDDYTGSSVVILGNNNTTQGQKGISVTYSGGSDAISVSVTRGVLGFVARMLTVANAITDNNYHSLIMTSDGAINKVYIDGVDTVLVTDSVGSLSSGDSTNDMNFGASGGGVLASKVSIDEVSFYTQYLPPSTANTIFSRGRKGPNLSDITGILSHYRMDSLTPTDLISGYNGTSVNMDATNIIGWS